MITQFQGEDRETAIVNHFSLDIVEEEAFFQFIKVMGYTIDAEDSIIESLYEMWGKLVEKERLKLNQKGEQ